MTISISPTKVEIAHVVVAVIGIVMILCSALISCGQESPCSKFLVITGDLGVGLFPTGIIGLVLERMQYRNREQEKKNKRIAILRLYNNAVHSYLNILCNAAIETDQRLIHKRVFEITTVISNGELQVASSNDEKAALTLLTERLRESFGVSNPLYIVTDVFETTEINHFEMLLQDGEKLLSLMNKHINLAEARAGFLSYLQVACSAIPECSSFYEMVSDGDNIYVPQ